MRNKYNANFYEESKFYNTNQNNTDERNLDNNRANEKFKYSKSISEVELGSEFNANDQDFKNKSTLGKKYNYNSKDFQKNNH